METLKVLLNGMSTSDFVAYYIMGFIGFVFSVTGQFYKAKNFAFKKWWNDEKFRIVTNLLAIGVGVIFTEQLTGSKINLLSAFEAGVFTDVIIDRFITKKSIEKKL